MYFFSELEREIGIQEAFIYKYAVDNLMQIISGSCGNKFLGLPGALVFILKSFLTQEIQSL